MRKWLKQLDELLRGELTRPEQLSEADIRIDWRPMAVLIVALAMIYGLCMGSFALIHGAEAGQWSRGILQAIANTIKVPALFFLTLVVTAPSLYVFNALVGSQLQFLPVVRLLIAFVAVNVAILASLGPIVAFFSISTPNYAFVLLLNVVVMSVAGLLGLGFLVQTLNRLSWIREGTVGRSAEAGRRRDDSPHSSPAPQAGGSRERGASKPGSESEPSAQAESPPTEPPGSPLQRPSERREQTGFNAGGRGRLLGPLDSQGRALGQHTLAVFACWTIVFGLVGAQMGWMLRPFIGSPDREFAWLRPRDSNFFEAMAGVLRQLFLGG